MHPRRRVPNVETCDVTFSSQQARLLLDIDISRKNRSAPISLVPSLGSSRNVGEFTRDIVRRAYRQ